MANDGCLNPEEFLTRTTEFFKIANEKKLAVHLTVKRLLRHDPVEGNLEYDATTQPHFDVSRKAQNTRVESSSQEEYPILIRISYGSHSKKTKCSTIVKAELLDKFWQDYSSVVKSCMNGLIKKKKKKSKSLGAKDKHGKRLKK